MYKIFVNQAKVYLAAEKNVPDFVESRKKVRLTYNSLDELSDILTYIEGEVGLNKAYIVGESKKQVWEDFRSLYKVVDAAGGVVYNEDTGKILFIFRRGLWDLPKGKVEKKEKIKAASIREVMEETGVSKPSLGDPIHFRKYKQEFLLHTYKLNGKRVLKRTFWFDMFLKGNQKLVPQLEEGIKEVKWVKPENLKNYFPKSFSSIKFIIKNSPHFRTLKKSEVWSQ